LKWFTEEWKPFIKGIIVREKVSKWDSLWDDFIQEELRDEIIHPKKKASDDDMELAT